MLHIKDKDVVMNGRAPALWGVILAVGEGEQLKGFVPERVGAAIPKQFSACVGRRSMLERTIRRARLLIPSSRLVIMGTAHYASYIYRSLGASEPHSVMLQPVNRDTAPGILLSLIHILRHDPHAVVAILPSDHFILPGHRFMRTVASAASFVTDKHVDCPILLAVKPDWPEPEYGWIEPGEFVEQGDYPAIRRINRFIEKPPQEQAERLMKDGWLWNTMVVVTRAEALMNLMREHAPDLTAHFSRLQQIWGSPRTHDLIKEMYQSIPSINFSTSILTVRDTKSLVYPIQDICWSDWETKERIFATATAIGLRASISVRTPHAPVTFPR